jgi:hypothetical protein
MRQQSGDRSQLVPLIADRPQLRGESVHRVGISSIPARVKLIVVRVMAMAKS